MQLIFMIYNFYLLIFIINFFRNHELNNFLNVYFIITILFCTYLILLEKLDFKNIIKLIGKFSFMTIILFFIEYPIEKLINLENYIETIEKYLNYKIRPLIILGVIYISIRYSKSLKLDNGLKSDLYKERKEDYQYIKEYIDNSNMNILGINEEYGVGKTYLVDKLLEELQNNSKKYEILKIRCLMLENNEIYSYITRELNKILRKNLIFTNDIVKTKESILRGVWQKYIGGVAKIFKYETSIDDIENFKKEIFKLDKKIVIVFDDIDRVGNVEKIDKILDFISEFSEKNIKMIVLYNLDNFKKINEKYTRNYIEKYIPLTRELTPISFVDLLKRKLKEKKLDENDFRFLYCLELKGYLIYDDITERMTELKFQDDFQGMFQKEVTYDCKISPRKIYNFVEEISEYLKNEELKIEKRFIIAYTFLKHIYYEEFYTKLNFKKGFEELFPIELEIQSQIPRSINLIEVDFIKSFILSKNKIIEAIDDNKDFIDIGDTRILLFNKKIKNKKLDEILRKIDITQKGISNDDFFRKLSEIFNEQSYEIIEGTNVLIYELFNYYLASTNDFDKAAERKEAIEVAIKKLKYLGNKDNFSAMKLFYEKISPILKKQDIKEMVEEYEDLIRQYVTTKEKIRTIFYIGNSFAESVIKCLKIFGTKEEKENFLELIYFKFNNQITDEYLQVYFESDLDSLKIRKFIIEEGTSDNIKILEKETLKQLAQNMNKIIKRWNSYGEYSKGEKLEEYFYSVSKQLSRELKLLKPNALELKKYLKMEIKFLEKLIEILKSGKLKKQKNEKDADVQIKSGGYTEEIESIKKLETEEEREREFIRVVLEKGYSMDRIEKPYGEVVKKL